jgi:hypothetical protein
MTTLMLFCRCALSPYQREPFLRLAFLGQGAVLDRRVSSLPQNVFVLYLPLKFCNRMQNLNYNNA